MSPMVNSNGNFCGEHKILKCISILHFSVFFCTYMECIGVSRTGLHRMCQWWKYVHYSSFQKPIFISILYQYLNVPKLKLLYENSVQPCGLLYMEWHWTREVLNMELFFHGSGNSSCSIMYGFSQHTLSYKPWCSNVNMHGFEMGGVYKSDGHLWLAHFSYFCREAARQGSVVGLLLVVTIFHCGRLGALHSRRWE
jgi:hypothetical protein